MTLSATEEHSTGAFHSHGHLGNPRKERESKIVCNSEPFLKPRMALIKVTFIYKMILDYFKSKGPEQKNSVPKDLHKPSKKEQSITENLSQRKDSEMKPLKPRVRKKQMSEKAGLQIPKEEWEIITSPSAKVILDPNTANPTLKLSVDGRSVRTKTHKDFHSSRSFHEYHRKYKHQYHGWTCVQAQEGYSTGRHYWEVDVKGKCDWRIGVVKESAPRSGFINLNTAAGYWTLRLQLGSLIALTAPVTKLNQAPLSKTGVYLDVEKGQVSFYDAKKRKHIYTFNAEFSEGENIYPVFGTVETDKPLKII